MSENFRFCLSSNDKFSFDFCYHCFYSYEKRYDFVIFFTFLLSLLSFTNYYIPFTLSHSHKVRSFKLKDKLYLKNV